MVFADVREPLYTDDCCHVSAKGYKLIAQSIAAAIRADEGPNESRTSTSGPDPRARPW